MSTKTGFSAVGSVTQMKVTEYWSPMVSTSASCSGGSDFKFGLAAVLRGFHRSEGWHLHGLLAAVRTEISLIPNIKLHDVEFIYLYIVHLVLLVHWNQMVTMAWAPLGKCRSFIENPLGKQPLIEYWDGKITLRWIVRRWVVTVGGEWIWLGIVFSEGLWC